MYVVGTDDPCIRKKHGRYVSLQTAQGDATAERVSLMTPLGLRDGLACSGSPRLMPMHDLRKDYTILWEEKHVMQLSHKTSGEVRRCRIVGGTPIFSGTVTKTRRGHQPKQQKPTLSNGSCPGEGQDRKRVQVKENRGSRCPDTLGEDEDAEEGAEEVPNGVTVGGCPETVDTYDSPRPDGESQGRSETGSTWSPDPQRQLDFDACRAATGGSRQNAHPPERASILLASQEIFSTYFLEFVKIFELLGSQADVHFYSCLRNGTRLGDSTEWDRQPQEQADGLVQGERTPEDPVGAERLKAGGAFAEISPGASFTHVSVTPVGPSFALGSATPKGATAEVPNAGLPASGPRTLTEMREDGTVPHAAAAKARNARHPDTGNGTAADEARCRCMACGAQTDPAKPKGKQRDAARPKRFFKSTTFHAAPATTLPEGHSKTHTPAAPKLCKICAETKRKRTAKQVGSATLESWGVSDSEAVITADLAEALDSANEHLVVVRLLKWPGVPISEPTQKGILFSQGTKWKESADWIDAIHDARVEWGIEDKPTALHSDNEVDTKAFGGYCKDTSMRLITGVPNESNTNPHGEQAVRAVTEGLASAMYSAPPELDMHYSHAASTWCINEQTRNGLPCRVNSVPKDREWGDAGVVAHRLRVKRHTKPRGTRIMFLSYNLKTPGGIFVLYADEKGDYKVACILERHVMWDQQKRKAFVVDDTTAIRPVLRMQLWFKQNADVGPEPDDGEVVDGDVVVPLPMSVNVMTRRLLELWQRAKGYDPEGTFAKPVLPELRRSDPETARLYERDVAHPMDFTTVKVKIQAHEYRDEGEFFNDLLLIGRNCWKFNRVGSDLHRYGRKFAGQVRDLQKAAQGRAPGRRLPVDLEERERTLKKKREAKRKRQKQEKELKRKEHNALIRENRGRHGRANPQRGARVAHNRRVNGMVSRAMCVISRHAMRDLQETQLEDETGNDLVDKAKGDVLRALLTRQCTKAEATSAEGEQARKEEVHKVCKFFGIAEPVTGEAAKRDFPKATTSGVHLLTSVKHAERNARFQVYKGRLVLLGNKISRLLDGVQVYPTGEQYGLHGDVVTLDGVRAVMAHAVVHRHRIQTVDITSAYLQALWPDDVPPHFLKLTPEVWRALPESLRKQADQLQAENPGCEILFRMRTCLYGHPISGHVWVTSCLRKLMELGWKPVEGMPAVLTKGECMICVYVDDLLAAGPDAELETCWQEIRKEFPAEEPVDATEFLGAEISRTTNSISISMKDYVSEIVRAFHKEFPDAPKIRQTCVPMVDALAHDAEQTKPQRRVQKLVGMLLWMGRNIRPDIAYAVSRLGTRVTKWDKKAEAELARVVQYLDQTKGARLVMKVGDGVKYHDMSVRTYSDANLAYPASQSGQFTCIIGPETLVPLSWRCKKQGLCVDSSGASEIIAAHQAVRDALAYTEGINSAILRTSQPMKLFVDNSSVIRNARRGNSPGLDWLKLAIKLRIGLLKDLTDLGLLNVDYVNTLENKADCLSKAMQRLKLAEHCKLMGLELA